MATQERVIDNITRRPQRVRVTSQQRGSLTWLLQRLTAYALLLFLGIHLFFNYYAPLAGGYQLTFEIASQRYFVIPVLYALNDFALLICALFHGLNGVRSIIYDVVTSEPVRSVVTTILIFIGLLFLYDGSMTLLALMQMTP